MGLPRQEYWSGLPFPPPEYLPHPGIKPASSALADKFFTIQLPGKPRYVVVVVKLLNHAWLFGTPRTVIHQAPLSMGFSRPISLYMVCLSNSQENFVRWVLLLSTLERRAKWVAKRTSDLPKVTFREETAVSGANSCFLCHLRGEGVRRERIHLLLLESLWESHNFV